MTVPNGIEKLSHEHNQNACKLYNELTKDIENVKSQIDILTQEVKGHKFNTSKGLSLLDLKNNTFLSYFSNLSYTTLLKLSGKSIENHPVIDRLIEQRIVIERLCPYENKLQNQITKYTEADKRATSRNDMSTKDFHTSANGKDDSDDDNPTGYNSKHISTDDGEDDGTGRYRISKVSQNKFPDAEAAKEKALAAKRRVLNSRMMQDFLEVHNLEPEEIHNSSALQRKAQKKKDEITKYEEENLTRVSVTKKDRALLRASYTAGAIHGELLGFSDVGVLSGNPTENIRKRKRSSNAGKGKKKGGKKKKH